MKPPPAAVGPVPPDEVQPDVHHQLDHLGQRDHRDADPQPELAPNIAQQLALRVVGRLDRLQHVAVGDEDVELREVLHRRPPVRHAEVLFVEARLLAVSFAGEPLMVALRAEDVDVDLLAVEAVGRPAREAVRDVVRHLVAGGQAAALAHRRRVPRHLRRPAARAVQPAQDRVQRAHAILGGVVATRRRDAAVVVAELERPEALLRRQTAVLTAAARHHRVLHALLLARQQAVSVRVGGVGERVRRRAVAVRRPDAPVDAGAHPERDRVAGRHVEALGVRERLRVGRVDHHPDALCSGHRAEPVVRAGQRAQVGILRQHPAAAQHLREYVFICIYLIIYFVTFSSFFWFLVGLLFYLFFLYYSSNCDSE